MWIWTVTLHGDVIYQYLEIRHSPCFKETQVSNRKDSSLYNPETCVLVTANKFTHTGIYLFSSPELKAVSLSKFVSFCRCERLTLLYMHLSQVEITRLISTIKNVLGCFNQRVLFFEREDHFANTKIRCFSPKIFLLEKLHHNAYIYR